LCAIDELVQSPRQFSPTALAGQLLRAGGVSLRERRSQAPGELTVEPWREHTRDQAILQSRPAAPALPARDGEPLYRRDFHNLIIGEITYRTRTGTVVLGTGFVKTA
jgi:hypothetical protein